MTEHELDAALARRENALAWGGNLRATLAGVLATLIAIGIGHVVASCAYLS